MGARSRVFEALIGGYELGSLVITIICSLETVIVAILASLQSSREQASSSESLLRHRTKTKGSRSLVAKLTATQLDATAHSKTRDSVQGARFTDRSRRDAETILRAIAAPTSSCAPARLDSPATALAATAN